jgi:hypothetical protein
MLDWRTHSTSAGQNCLGRYESPLKEKLVVVKRWEPTLRLSLEAHLHASLGQTRPIRETLSGQLTSSFGNQRLSPSREDAP